MRARVDSALRWWAVASAIGWVVLLAFAIGTVSNAEAAPVAANPNQEAPRIEHRRDAPQTTVDQVSSTVMCPSCDTTLDQSDSPAAQRMRAWVVAAVDAGWTEEEIRDGLVEEYGGDESVLATPRAEGVGLAVWIVPAIIALAALVVGWFSLRRWRRDAASGGQPRSTSSSASHASSASQSSSPSTSTASPSSPPSAR